MGVYISNETMDSFHNNGFTDEQIDTAIADYRQKGFADDEIGNMLKNDFSGSGNGTPLLHGSVSNIEKLPSDVNVSNKSFVKNPITRMRYGFSNDLDGIANAIYKDYPDVEQVYKDPYRQELIAKRGDEYFPVNPKGFDMGDIPGVALPMVPEIVGGTLGGIGGGAVAGLAGPEAVPFGAYAGTVAGTGAGNIVKQNLAGLMGTQNNHDWGETGTSTAITAALPVAGKIVQPVMKPVGNFVSKMARVPVDAVKRAVQPNSKALDMSADEARNLLTKTTTQVQGDYNDIIDTLGQNVGDAAKRLPENKKIYAQRIKDHLDDIYNSYQTGNRKEANVAYNEAGKLNNYFKDLIDNSSDAVRLTGNELGSFSDHKGLEDAAINFYKNNFQGNSIKKSGITINFTKKGRKETISQARKPEMNDNLKFIPKLDEIIEKGKFHGFNPADKDKYINSKTLFGYIDTPVLMDGEKKIARVTLRKDSHGEIYYNINDKIKIIDRIKAGDDSLNVSAGNATVSKSSPEDIITQFDENIKLGAPEVHDLLKNINAKVNWNDPKSKIQNEILERFYGATSNELSKMSPELAAANKAFANAKEFQTKEGLRQILYPSDSDKVDAASSILKNYAGFTRGNREQNLIELEKFLTDNGKRPFIEVLQDINATQALNQAYTTGDSTLANFVNSFVLEPALRTARGYNRAITNIPSNVKEPFKKIKYSSVVSATASQNDKKRREPFVKKQVKGE